MVPHCRSLADGRLLLNLGGLVRLSLYLAQGQSALSPHYAPLGEWAGFQTLEGSLPRYAAHGHQMSGLSASRRMATSPRPAATTGNVVKVNTGRTVIQVRSVS